MKRCLFAALLALAIAAQESEKAATSTLTGAALPEGAKRVLAKEAKEQAATILKSAYADSRFASIEAIYWEGDYSAEKGAELRRAAAKAIEKAGHAYKESLSDRKLEGRDVYLCGVVREKRRIVGLWIASGEAAMLVWGEEQPAAAKPAEAVFQNVIYSAPPGWTVTVAGDGVTLAPGDLLPEERLSVLILSGHEFKDALASSVEALFEETCKEFAVDPGDLPSSAKGEARTSGRGWEYVRVRTTVKKDEARLFMDAWFIKVGGRLERVVALTNFVNQPYAQSPLTSPKYDDTFLRFVHGLRFKNHKEPVLPPGSLSGDGLAGVWVGMGLGFDGRRGELGYKSFTAAFYTNGLVFFAAKLQTFLFEGMDPYIAREIAPSSWGTYTFESGRGVIKMASGELPLELDGEKLVITRLKTPHTYVRLDSVDGMRWNGTWAFESTGGKTPEITFTKDGGFTDNGAVKVLEHSLYALHSTGDKPGGGTYEVKNHTVVLTYSDGRRFTTAYLGLLAKKGEPAPETLTLGFNHDTLKRK